jgi:hypothetical protein
VVLQNALRFTHGRSQQNTPANKEQGLMVFDQCKGRAERADLDLMHAEFVTFAFAAPTFHACAGFPFGLLGLYWIAFASLPFAITWLTAMLLTIDYVVPSAERNPWLVIPYTAALYVGSLAVLFLTWWLLLGTGAGDALPEHMPWLPWLGFAFLCTVPAVLYPWLRRRSRRRAR